MKAERLSRYVLRRLNPGQREAFERLRWYASGPAERARLKQATWIVPRLEVAFCRIGDLLYAAAEHANYLKARCLDCRANTYENGEYYMLREPVWLEANPGDEGMLCFDCLERRLGRKLRQSDFTLAPVNYEPVPFSKWVRAEPR